MESQETANRSWIKSKWRNVIVVIASLLLIGCVAVTYQVLNSVRDNIEELPQFSTENSTISIPETAGK